MSDDRARAFWVTSPGCGEIRDERLPVPGADELLVRTLYSGVSRGSESLVYLGSVPESEYQRMRAPFQAGEFPAPVKYGYSSVGTVEQGPDAWLGRRVFCLYPHQTRYVVPLAAVYALPPGVPPARAVLAANLETAVNALWDAAPCVGDRVSVVGAGTVGCLVAWLAAGIPGVELQLVDVDERRAELAASLSLDFATPAAAAGEADVVFHASGSPEGLETAVRLTGFESDVWELSWFGNSAVPLPLGGQFHSRRLSLRASQVGHVARRQRSRWSPRRRMELALRLLREDSLDRLVTGESEFASLPATMARLAREPDGELCHRIVYS